MFVFQVGVVRVDINSVYESIYSSSRNLTALPMSPQLFHLGGESMIFLTHLILVSTKSYQFSKLFQKLFVFDSTEILMNVIGELNEDFVLVLKPFGFNLRCQQGITTINLQNTMMLQIKSANATYQSVFRTVSNTFDERYVFSKIGR